MKTVSHITKEEFNELYTRKKRSLTKRIDGIKIQTKTVKGRIELRVNNEFVGDTIGDYDFLIDLIDESIEIQKSYNDYYQAIEQEKEDLVKNGAKYFSLSDIKTLLLEVVPGYLGQKQVALTDSEYWNVNGKTVRFSDHSRPATSKWNFIHGENTIEAPEGLLTVKMITEWLTGVLEIRDLDIDMIEEQFTRKKIRREAVT